MDMDDDASAGDGLPPSVRFLKWLVILLTLTMIGGVITVVAVIVTRMPQAVGGAAALTGTLPETIALPQGAEPRAATFGTGWIAVVVRDPDGAERILVYTPEGRLRQEVTLIQP
jgi:hypothetical protein